jgi:hypothetical protein
MSRTTHDDDLRALLARLDPCGPAVPVDSVAGPRAHELLEHIMQTTDEPTVLEPHTSASRWRGPALLTAAAAAVIAIGVGAALVASNGSDAPKPTAPTRAATTLALNVPGGISMVSCVPFSVTFLRDMPVALGGTVTAAEPGKVTLKVDHWYKGGDADQVTIAQPDPQSSVALDGVTFEQGNRYLLTATNGTVNGCGFSGPATPKLEQSFKDAFGG